MSERGRFHERTSREPSGLVAEVGSKGKRNFVDPTLLEASTQTTYADAVTALGVGAGAALTFVGAGVGWLFYKKGEAVEMMARQSKTKVQPETKVKSREIPQAEV